MRTLNRPMFNMGGPIKEGVMHGIREPYRHGRRVGYKDGGWGDYFKNIFTKATPVVKQVVGKKAKPIIAATDKIADQKWLQSLHPSRIKETISGITGSGAGQSFMQNLRSFPGVSKIPGWATKVKDLAFKYPKTTALSALYGGPTVIAGAKQIPWSGIGGFLDPRPGWRKAFGIEDKVIDVPTDVPLNPNLQNIPEPKSTDTGSDYGQFTRAQKRIAEARATELAKKRKDDRINDLLEMMGYDQSKKDAAYNALLDASQIISQAPGGESLDISRDIIQPAIAATSKRFDKPQEIEEAVRLMQTKADIQKDMTKEETALANRAKDLQIKVHEKTLAGPSLTEAYNAYFEKHGSYPSGDSLANLARTKGVEIESVVDTKSVNSWLKNNKGKDEVDFMEVEVKKAKEDNTPITPGVYVVTDRIIIVGVDGKVKSSL